jgi:hypothetical protein
MKETQSNVRGDKVSRAILEYLDDLGLSKRKTKLKPPSFWDVLASSLFLGGPEKFKIVGVGKCIYRSVLILFFSFSFYTLKTSTTSTSSLDHLDPSFFFQVLLSHLLTF